MGQSLVPACGGTENVFTVAGVRWLYCWDQDGKQHCYLNLDTDTAVYNRSFHPAFSPQFTDDVPDPTLAPATKTPTSRADNRPGLDTLCFF